MVSVSVYASDYFETTATQAALAAVAPVTATSAPYRRPCEASCYSLKTYFIPFLCYLLLAQ